MSLASVTATACAGGAAVKMPGQVFALDAGAGNAMVVDDVQRVPGSVRGAPHRSPSAKLRTSSAASRLSRDLVLIGTCPLGPVGRDIVQHRLDLARGQRFAESRHSTHDPRHSKPPQRLGASQRHVVEEQLVGVVPGMAAVVMGRRPQRPVRLRALPVGLPLKVRPVARGAMLGIDQ